MQIISILVPVYNEEKNIIPLYKEIRRVFQNLKEYDYEIIFTDNNSEDSSFEKIREINKNDKKVKGYSFQKNYGKEKSIFYGYKICSGDAAIQLDCDMQDPPNLIPMILEKWKDNIEVVYCRRDQRDEFFFLSYLRKLFYIIIKFLSKNSFVKDVGDFCLISRKVINEITKYEKENLFLRGLISGLNYKFDMIDYERPDRNKGKSKFSLKNYFSIFINAITFQSTSPLRFISFISIVVSFVSLFGILFYFFSKIIYPERSPDGFATQTILIIIVLCFNSLFLSVIGEYVSKMYEELIKKEKIIIKDKSI
tara:strand:+ start:505 stop:1431 length:927 start_codon:yes stop_codon:yes gene_type:complete